MCGIVGYLGSSNAVPVVLAGLKRLEYRGYDSCGVSFRRPHEVRQTGQTEQAELILAKRVGRSIELEKDLQQRPASSLNSTSCLGHTRWATHGKVNTQNAHPHQFGTISIVHNGIIENSAELKKTLADQGFEFKTDMENDSEVFLGLVVMELQQQKELKQAITSAFKKIKGNSAFVIQEANRGKLYGIKRGQPLVCGLCEPPEAGNAADANASAETGSTGSGASAVMISSDPYALVGKVSQLCFPDDEVLCSLEFPASLKFNELSGDPSNRLKCVKTEGQLHPSDPSEKGEFEHFMLKEIYQQPDLIRRLVQVYGTGEGLAKLQAAWPDPPQRIHLVACGTAYYAGMVVRDFLEGQAGIPAQCDLASEFRYRPPLLKSGEMAIFISQSGETADTLAAEASARKCGLSTYSIINVEHSTLYRHCTENFPIYAGNEIGVASTKAFTLQALTGRLIASAFAQIQSASPSSQHEKWGLSPKILRRFHLLAERIEELLENTQHIKEIAEAINHYKGFFFTGRGQYYPVALEGALKLKEIAYVHAEGYAAGELKHGPIALIEEKMVNVAIIGPELYEKTFSNIQEVAARRGVIIALGQRGDEKLAELCDYFIPLNFSDLQELSPLYVNVATQLLSYYVAYAKGTDIDRPRNLAKSVTVE